MRDATAAPKSGVLFLHTFALPTPKPRRVEPDMLSCFGDRTPWLGEAIVTSRVNAAIRVYCYPRTVTGMPLVVGHAVVYIRRDLPGDASPLHGRLGNQGYRREQSF